MMQPSLLPIQIRPDGHRVWIAGIPHDLRPDEAEKIARVVVAMANPAPPENAESSGNEGA